MLPAQEEEVNFEKAEPYRMRVACSSWDSQKGDRYGVFIFKGPFGHELRCIASDATPEAPWEHVSVSLPNRTPNWPEMCTVKDLFWNEEDTVMQLHPAKADYVNIHQHCLHLWRPVGIEIPCPPLWLV